MTWRRLVPLSLAVAALVVVVAFAARGQPLGTGAGKGSGLPGVFWDYVLTTLLILLVLVALSSIAALFYFRGELTEQQPYRKRTARSLAILIAVCALVFLVGRHIDLRHLLHPHRKSTPTLSNIGGAGKGKRRSAQPPPERHFRWDELAIVVAVLLALGVAAALRGRPDAVARRRHAPEALAAALDESLDDLRTDTDLRRAIIAAYARMERALAGAGLPRRPAEAPLEYLERALLSLEASAPAVRRLTDLFEWARFSHHEPEPAMRDEAVDALVAVRDELRAAEAVAA